MTTILIAAFGLYVARRLRRERAERRLDTRVRMIARLAEADTWTKGGRTHAAR